MSSVLTFSFLVPPVFTVAGEKLGKALFKVKPGEATTRTTRAQERVP